VLGMRGFRRHGVHRRRLCVFLCVIQHTSRIGPRVLCTVLL
jgi:hypothetical protein